MTLPTPWPTGTRGFGHLAVSVDNVEPPCKRLEDAGYVSQKKLMEEGRGISPLWRIRMVLDGDYPYDRRGQGNGADGPPTYRLKPCYAGVEIRRCEFEILSGGLRNDISSHRGAEGRRFQFLLSRLSCFQPTTKGWQMESSSQHGKVCWDLPGITGRRPGRASISQWEFRTRRFWTHLCVKTDLCSPYHLESWAFFPSLPRLKVGRGNREETKKVPIRNCLTMFLSHGLNETGVYVDGLDRASVRIEAQGVNWKKRLTDGRNPRPGRLLGQNYSERGIEMSKPLVMGLWWAKNSMPCCARWDMERAREQTYYKSGRAKQDWQSSMKADRMVSKIGFWIPWICTKSLHGSSVGPEDP